MFFNELISFIVQLLGLVEDFKHLFACFCLCLSVFPSSVQGSSSWTDATHILDGPSPTHLKPLEVFSQTLQRQSPVVLNPVRLSQGDHHRRLLPFLKRERRQGHFLLGMGVGLGRGSQGKACNEYRSLGPPNRRKTSWPRLKSNGIGVCRVVLE